MHILVTRPHGQEQAIVETLRQAGYAVTHQPAFSIQPLPLVGTDRQHLMDLDQYHFVFVVSANAARIGLEALSGFWPQWPEGIEWIAVGKATAQALRAQQIEPLVPETGFNSEAALALPALAELSDRKVLILGGEDGRTLFAETLVSRGARVDRLALYRRGCNDAFVWPEESVDAVMVTSVRAWHCLESVAPADKLSRTKVIAGSARIAALVGATHPNVLSAASPHDDDMLSAALANLSPVPRNDAVAPSDQPAAANNTDPDTTAPRGTSGIVAPSPARRPMLSGIMALLALFAIGALGWMGFHYHTQVHNDLTVLRTDMTSVQSRLKDERTWYLAQSQRQKSQLDALEMRVDELSRKAAVLDQSSGMRHWLLSEAEALASLAQQRLLLTGDVIAAASLLKAADGVLAQLDEIEVLSVRRALMADHEALMAAASVDVTSLVLRLSALREQVPAVVVAGRRPASTGVEVMPEDTGLWAKIWQNLPLTVRRHDGTAQLPLTSEQQALVILMIETALQQSSLALMQGHAQSYVVALANARSMLRRWLSETSPEVAGFDKALSALAAEPVHQSLPDISAGVAAVRALRQPEAHP